MNASNEFMAIVTITVLMVWTLAGFLGYYLDSKAWNNGISRKSGLPWKQFDTDIQGGKGYHDGVDDYIWISWPIRK